MASMRAPAGLRPKSAAAALPGVNGRGHGHGVNGHSTKGHGANGHGTNGCGTEIWRKPRLVELMRLPAVVVAGEPSGGKTALLDHVLHEQQHRRLAVIENGTTGVGAGVGLAERNWEETTVLENGCVRRSAHGDPQRALRDLAVELEDGRVVMDGVVIELPDAADPAPVVRTFLTDEAVRRWFYVDNVIALVNAARCLEQLDGRGGDPSREGAARAQLALASFVLLSGADLADEAALAECEHRLKELNGAANIVRFQEACVPLERLIDVNAFDHTRNGTFGRPVRGGSRAPGPPCARRRLLYQHFAL